MMGEVNDTLERLYPSKRWHERADHLAMTSGVSQEEGRQLALALCQKLKAFALYKPGTPEDFSDYIYVLCFGRQPSILEVREGVIDLADFIAQAPEGEESGVKELYLRVALSSLCPFAAVQEVRMSLSLLDNEPGNAVSGAIVEEQVRAGVFDPILLARYQKLVAVLAETNIRNIDFGEINEAPEGFDGSAHEEMFGAKATIANYLFFAGPSAGISAECVLAKSKVGNQSVTFAKAFGAEFVALG
jgi:hypothetical protein